MCHILEVDSVRYGSGLNIVEKKEGFRNVRQVSEFINELDGGGFF